MAANVLPKMDAPSIILIVAILLRQFVQYFHYSKVTPLLPEAIITLADRDINNIVIMIGSK